MDSINVTYRRLTIANDKKAVLETQLQICRNTLQEIEIERDGFRSALNNALQVIKNKDQEILRIETTKNQEIQYYKALKSPKLKNYLTGFAIGILTAIVGILVL